MALSKEKIELLSFFKNNVEWYVPTNKTLLDIDEFKHYEIISFYAHDNFLVLCWNETKLDARLFKAKYNH